MKSLLKSIISNSGYNLIRKDSSEVWVDKVETPHGRRANFLQHLVIQVVLDVGAHIGWYAADLRSYGYLGRIVSSDPRSSHSKNWKKDPMPIQIGFAYKAPWET